MAAICFPKKSNFTFIPFICLRWCICTGVLPHRRQVWNSPLTVFLLFQDNFMRLSISSGFAGVSFWLKVLIRLRSGLYRLISLVFTTPLSFASVGLFAELPPSTRALSCLPNFLKAPFWVFSLYLRARVRAQDSLISQYIVPSPFCATRARGR